MRSKADQARSLVYPLRFNADMLHRYLETHVEAPPYAAGRLAVETIMALNRAQAHARKLHPFDPTGL